MKKELYIILLITLFVFSSCNRDETESGINGTWAEVQINWWWTISSDTPPRWISDSLPSDTSWSNTSWLDINQ